MFPQDCRSTCYRLKNIGGGRDRSARVPLDLLLGDIVLYGAELTRGWADTFGRGVKPRDGAIELVEQEKTVKAG
jgi:hypothetical protein